MKYANHFVYLLLIELVKLTNANNLKVDDACQITKTSKPGICKLLAHCTEAKNDLNYNAILPTSCGYQGFQQIVCCPTPVETTRISTEPDLPIAIRKCKEYSRYVFKNITLLTLNIDSDAITNSVDLCGHKSVPLIIGGTPANSKEFPHSALLGYKQLNGDISWDCGGSLVSTRYILTAAHCLKSPQNGIEVTIVRLGELILNDETDDAELTDIAVERKIKFSDYRTSKRYNDIALLKLADKVPLSPYIHPICLPSDDLNPDKLIATGWGTVDFHLARSNALLKVVLESFNNTECNEIFKHSLDRKIPKGIIKTQLCAGSRNDSRDTCQGDSGGPLQIYNSEEYCMYTQIGITSYGIGCGTVNFPGVYTRLYSYVRWIENVIWAPGEDD